MSKIWLEQVDRVNALQAEVKTAEERLIDANRTILKYIRKCEEQKEELERFYDGFQGACYACETVGETNLALEKELQLTAQLLDFAVARLSETDFYDWYAYRKDLKEARRKK